MVDKNKTIKSALFRIINSETAMINGSLKMIAFCGNCRFKNMVTRRGMTEILWSIDWMRIIWIGKFKNAGSCELRFNRFVVILIVLIILSFSSAFPNLGKYLSIIFRLIQFEFHIFQANLTKALMSNLKKNI